MRRISRNLAAGFVLALALAGSSCWFSTTPPKPSGSGPDNEDPSAAVVTGSVQFFDRTDHHTRSAPGWLVQASWYVSGGGGDPLRLDHREVTYSNSSAVYEIRYVHPKVVAVDVQARICVVDLDGMDCCLSDPPCSKPECTSIWSSAKRVLVGPGGRTQQSLIVACDQVP